MSDSEASTNTDIEGSPRTPKAKASSNRGKGAKLEIVDPSGAEHKENFFLRIWHALFPPEDQEKHKSQQGTAGWLRAGVLGANDAIVSVAAVMVTLIPQIISLLGTLTS